MNYSQFFNDLHGYYKKTKVEQIHIDQVKKWIARNIPENDLNNALDVITANCTYYPSVAELNNIKTKGKFSVLRPVTYNKEFILRMKQLKAMFTRDMSSGTVEEWSFFIKNEPILKKWEEEEEERRILAMTPAEKEAEAARSKEALKEFMASIHKVPSIDTDEEIIKKHIEKGKPKSSYIPAFDDLPEIEEFTR